MQIIGYNLQMIKEGMLASDVRLKAYFAVALLGFLSLINSSCAVRSGEATQVDNVDPVVTVTIDTYELEPTSTPIPERILPELVEAMPMGLIGEDIKNIEDISQQPVDFKMDFAQNAELIKYLFDFKEIVQIYATEHGDISENPYTQGQEFRDYIYDQMSQLGYGDLLDSEDGQIALAYLADYYKNPDYEDSDGNKEVIQCMESQIFASAARSKFWGSPVFLTSFPGDALALASDMLAQNDGGRAPNIRDSHVVKFPNDRFDINIVQPADTVAIRYGEYGGHVVTILAKAHNQHGEMMVLVFGSNRIVVDGKLITNGIPELRWETSEFFSAQNETSISQAVIIRADNP